MRSRFGPWLALATSAALVSVAVTVWSRWQEGREQRMATGWDRQIVALDEPAAAAFVRSLRQHDTLAIAPLTKALADQRPLVSAAARESVGNLVADWKQLPARDSVPRLTDLARELANGYETFPPANQQFSRQLAQSLLLWPLEDADFPADGLVAQCERVLIAPLPTLPDLAAGTAPPTNSRQSEAAPPSNSASPQLATRPQPAPEGDPPLAAVQEAAPIGQPPTLVSPQADDPAPVPPAADPTPQPPRQFIRPRVPPIPRPVEP